MKCRVIHNVVGHCILPRVAHSDEVSYLDAFVIDSILVTCRLHLGYMIIQHIIDCWSKKGWILSYGWLLTKIFEAIGIDLSYEPDMEKPSPYDKINGIALSRMKIIRSEDGSWSTKGESKESASAFDGNEEGSDEEEEERTRETDVNTQPPASQALWSKARWLVVQEEMTSISSRMDCIEHDQSDLKVLIMNKHDEIMKKQARSQTHLKHHDIELFFLVVVMFPPISVCFLLYFSFLSMNRCVG